MKINEIKINSFGKLKDKEIELKDNINIISGKNESGKTTLIKFILNSFYGISKNKKGKEYSDFEKYLPWVGEEFSGKIKYELDNKEEFEVYRDFRKKNPQIFNNQMEDISKQFNIDKSKGNEFFYEQTKVDEELFLSTVLVNQQEVKLAEKEQNLLVQKIANLVGTGDDNVSYKRATERINRRLLDEVGTAKSREKPINIVSRKIEELEYKKDRLANYQNIQYEIEENKSTKKEYIEELKLEEKLTKDIKLLFENKKIEEEKIKIKEKIKNENEEKIKNIKNEIQEIEENKKIEQEKNIQKNKRKIKNEKNKLNKKIILLFILLIILNILQFIFIKNKNINYLFLITIPVFLIISYFIIKAKNKKIENMEIAENEEEKEINLKINQLKNEKNLIEKNNIELEKELKIAKNNFQEKINSEKEKIKNKYFNKIEKNKINYFLELNNLENINMELQKIQTEINEEQISYHQLEIDKKNIEPKLDELSKIEEELVNNKEKMSTLQKLSQSINLAKEVLTNCYEEMRNTVTPKFTEELSRNIEKITNGKYKNVMFNDYQGLLVESENGNYVEAGRLSIGTIDQLYLSLRFSMIEELSDEKMPIILDEAFAYFDDDRLENILKYINEKSKNHQIIIFTCTNREKEILENLNIDFNEIEIG